MQRILPAYPLFVKDPNFSLWANAEQLNEGNLTSWWGETKKLYGFLKTEGKTYCFMGNAADFFSCGVQKAEQTSLSVTAFSTDYAFRAGNAELKLRFVSPLLPNDLTVLSRPVCYMEYEISGADDAEISLFINRSVAYNAVNEDKRVRGGKVGLKGFETAFFGLARQLPLSNNDDAIGADWGYWYLSGERAQLSDEKEVAAYLAGGFTEFAGAGEEKYLASLNTQKKGAVMLGFDETVAIDYFGTYLKGYYFDGKTIFDALSETHAQREEINKKLQAYDKELVVRAEKYGKEYVNVLYASRRQSVAAHKLAKDGDGKLLFLSKENCSNGCIATVDVSYPSMPLYLLYNPELVKGMMRPVLKFADMPIWTYDFAPHDAGTYPACCGQVYGLKKGNVNLNKEGFRQTHFPFYALPESFEAYDFNDQMPVEECANMLVMFLACYRRDGDLSFFREHLALAKKWVEYLVKFGLKPDNQLCTDDFAGHLKNNLNLAIKATVGIAAYAELLTACGIDGQKFRKTAELFAGEITAFGKRFVHTPITWDSDADTFSLKYNLAFDKIFKLGLFPRNLLESEVDCYRERQNAFGTPLDNRETYTKSDWLVWAASLTDDSEKRKKIISALDYFLKNSPDRVPFGDWFDTVSGKYLHFRARSVQGGCFILLL